MNTEADLDRDEPTPWMPKVAPTSKKQQRKDTSKCIATAEIRNVFIAVYIFFDEDINELQHASTKAKGTERARGSKKKHNSLTSMDASLLKSKNLSEG